MARELQKRGEITSWDEPVWEPLKTLLGIYVEDFMWMFAVKLEDGTRIHGFKHGHTRSYLYLSDDDRTFVYEEPNLYREVEAREIVNLAMPAICDFACCVDRSCRK